MNSNKKTDNFVAQAGILAVAGIISRVIGLLYRSPLNAIIGEEGHGYYSSAYGFYTMILLISSYTIPAALSKVIAQKLAEKEYRNAHRLFYGAIVYVLAVGGIASLFLFFGAGLFVQENAIPVLRMFAPTIFIYGMLGVLRGYFQAHKSMVQTSISQILEQIANAIVSVLGAYVLIQLFAMDPVSGEVDSTRQAVYGAMGSALGTGIGVVTGLIFMAGMYALNRKMILRRVRNDKHTQVDSYLDIMKTITVVVTPFILATAIYNLSSSVNNYLYNMLFPTMKAVDESISSFRWGIFAGQSLTVSNIPIAFASAMTSAVIPSVARLLNDDQREELHEKIGVSVKSTMVISIPCAVGLFVLAKPIMFLLFPRKDEIVTMAAGFLMTLSLSVIFYALSTLNQSILQGIGRARASIVNAAIALVLQTVLAVVLLWGTDLDIYSIAIANTFYSGMMCVLNQLSVRKYVGYKQEMKRTFVLPFVASVIMGGVAFGVYQGLYALTRSMRISLIPAVIVAVPVYFVVLILLGGMTEAELRTIPKGYLLVKVFKKLKLMR